MNSTNPFTCPECARRFDADSLGRTDFGRFEVLPDHMTVCSGSGEQRPYVEDSPPVLTCEGCALTFAVTEAVIKVNPSNNHAVLTAPLHWVYGVGQRIDTPSCSGSHRSLTIRFTP